MPVSTLVPEVDHTWPLHVSISADGRYVVFANYFALEQANIVADDTLDVFRVDTQTGQLQMVSGPHNASLSRADSPTVSADGTEVAFRSMLDGSDGSTLFGIAVKNMVTGSLVQVAGGPGSAPLYYDQPGMSDDGRLVAYTTRASYGDTSNETVVVQDVQTKQIVYHLDGQASIQALQLSGDGHALLIAGQGVQVVDLAKGSSQTLAGAIDPFYGAPSISADGRYVLYAANASAVLDGGSASENVLVRKDLQTGAVKPIVEAPNDDSARYFASGAQMSADGKLVAFGGDAVTHAFTTGTRTTLVMNLDTGGVIEPLGPNTSRLDALGNGVLVYETPSEVHPEYITEGTLKLMTFAPGAALTGTAGNDVLSGGPGDDLIDGGAGTDTVSYAGRHDGYVITPPATAGGAWTVQDTSGKEGTDQLVNVERLHFADTDLALDIAGTAGQAYRLYQAAFARTPDLAGLGYWIGVMDKGESLHDVAEAFVASSEFTTLYGANPANRDVVEKFYENVLHRPGEEAGVAWWTDVLDRKGGTLADVLIGFSESTENQAALVGVTAHGIAYTPYA